jgi:hypothetical protein
VDVLEAVEAVEDLEEELVHHLNEGWQYGVNHIFVNYLPTMGQSQSQMKCISVFLEIV